MRDMDGDALHPIGELARRTGLTVKAVRFYSDRGIVPPADRSPGGYRLYDIDALERLDLVRTLRDLGLDLATVRKVVDRELSLAEVAVAHVEALDVQIRTLRLRRAVLTVAARRGATPEEMDFMHKLAKLSEDERLRLVGDFLDAVFGGLDGGPDGAPEFVGVMRSMTPELPDDPTAEQVEAWVELAEMAQDADFRAGVRRMVEHYVGDRTELATGLGREPAAVVREQVGPALAAGVDPASAQADAVVAAVVARYARVLGRPDDGELRRRLASWLEAASDPLRERYLQLLAVINGWPAPERTAAEFGWALHAVRVRTRA